MDNTINNYQAKFDGLGVEDIERGEIKSEE